MYTTPFVPQRIRPLRRVEYDQLIELGAFQNERIELIEGLLVPMSPIGPPHDSVIQKLTALLVPPLLDRASVRIQLSFAALDISEPIPDVAIVPCGEYNTAHPDQAYLIIEVADSSLSFDRGAKRRLYATCGVPDYWIVNVAERVIEVYREPSAGAYTRVERYEHGQSVRPLRFDDLEVRVADVIK